MPTVDPSVPSIQITQTAATMTVELHHPARANALNDDMLAALIDVMASPPEGIRVVVLTGAGDRHFSAGLDLGTLTGQPLADRLRQGEAILGRAAHAIADCPVPVIAAINGAAFGGALELALACDWRIGSDTAQFGMPAARLGVVYAPSGLRRFAAVLGPGHLRQLFLTGRTIDATRACEIGLLDQVVSAAQMPSVIDDECAQVVRAAPGAVAGMRAALRVLEGDLDASITSEIARIRQAAYASPEFMEGLMAFRERRAPRWSPPSGD